MVAGDPEAGVSVEAVGLAACSHLQEEALTAQDGLFRSATIKNSPKTFV